MDTFMYLNSLVQVQSLNSTTSLFQAKFAAFRAGGPGQVWDPSAFLVKDEKPEAVKITTQLGISDDEYASIMRPLPPANKEELERERSYLESIDDEFDYALVVVDEGEYVSAIPTYKPDEIAQGTVSELCRDFPSPIVCGNGEPLRVVDHGETVICPCQNPSPRLAPNHCDDHIAHCNARIMEVSYLRGTGRGKKDVDQKTRLLLELSVAHRHTIDLRSFQLHVRLDSECDVQNTLEADIFLDLGPAYPGWAYTGRYSVHGHGNKIGRTRHLILKKGGVVEPFRRGCYHYPVNRPFVGPVNDAPYASGGCVITNKMCLRRHSDLVQHKHLIEKKKSELSMMFVKGRLLDCPRRRLVHWSERDPGEGPDRFACEAQKYIVNVPTTDYYYRY